MKRIALLAILFLAACTSVPAAQIDAPTQENLQQIAAADVAQALQTAKANNDVDGAKCWTVVQANLTTLNVAVPQVAGVASAIETKRVLKARLSAGLPPAVVEGCAMLYVEERQAAMNDFMRLLGLLH